MLINWFDIYMYSVDTVLWTDVPCRIDGVVSQLNPNQVLVAIIVFDWTNFVDLVVKRHVCCDNARL